MKCWDFTKCGREGGGSKAAELGVCPAWPDHGTSCALVAGTHCGGQVQGSFAQKVDSCASCDFYKITQVTQHSQMISQNLVEQCPIGIIGVNRRGMITMFNPAAESLLGRDRRDVLGQLDISVVYLSADEGRKIKKILHSPEHGRPGRLEGLDAVVRDAQGQPIPIKLWGFILLEDGAEVGSVGFFYDLREEKKAQESQIMKEKLQSILHMAGAVLHHLSQPLQVLVSDSNLLLQEVPPDHPTRESVEAIAQSINDIKGLLGKIGKISSTATTNYVGDTKILDLDNEAGPLPGADREPRG
jgi:PAS domain S-box-containing protein